MPNFHNRVTLGPATPAPSSAGEPSQSACRALGIGWGSLSPLFCRRALPQSIDDVGLQLCLCFDTQEEVAVFWAKGRGQELRQRGRLTRHPTSQMPTPPRENHTIPVKSGFRQASEDEGMRPRM